MIRVDSVHSSFCIFIFLRLFNYSGMLFRCVLVIIIHMTPGLEVQYVIPLPWPAQNRTATSFLRSTILVRHRANMGHNSCTCSNVVTNGDDDHGQGQHPWFLQNFVI